MNVQSAMQTGEEMQRHLMARATEDEEFRAQLVADPNATIRQEFDIEVPDHINIQVHESDGNVLHLALPPGPNIELDEERLEAIAAGLCCCG